MATNAISTSAFIDKLLMPIPAQEEQVMSTAYTRLLVAEWSASMDSVRYAEAEHAREAIGLRLKIAGHAERFVLLSFRNLIAAQVEQCLVPAPTAKELRWKKRCMHSVLEAEGVAEAIARDEARLA